MSFNIPSINDGHQDKGVGALVVEVPTAAVLGFLKGQNSNGVIKAVN